MIKIILSASIVVAALSTGVEAANMGNNMMRHGNHSMMMGTHKNPHLIKLRCKAYTRYAHGKCESMMNSHK